jgi:molecular chaperone GrpE
MDDKPQQEKSTTTTGTEKKGKKGTKTAQPSLRSLKEEIKSLKQELEECRDRALRQAAEFDNFRKRKNRESAEWVRSARETLLRELLPVVDDFDRLFHTGSSNNDAQWKGVVLIHEKLLNILRTQGLTSMDSLGKPFDPDYHDALLTVARDDVEPGTVVEVHEKGYLMNDRVLRHAKVVVSKAAEPEEDNNRETADTASEE